jgi:hypothetical protein
MQIDSATHPYPSLDVAGSDKIPGDLITPEHCRRLLGQLLKCLEKRSPGLVDDLRHHLREARCLLTKVAMAQIEEKLVLDILRIGCLALRETDPLIPRTKPPKYVPVGCTEEEMRPLDEEYMEPLDQYAALNTLDV